MGNYYYRQPCRVCIALLLIPGVSPVTSLKLVAGSVIEGFEIFDLTLEAVTCAGDIDHPAFLLRLDMRPVFAFTEHSSVG